MVGGINMALKSRHIKTDDKLWGDFLEAIKILDPDLNRSAVIKKFMRRYIEESKKEKV